MKKIITALFMSVMAAPVGANSMTDATNLTPTQQRSLQRALANNTNNSTTRQVFTIRLPSGRIVHGVRNVNTSTSGGLNRPGGFSTGIMHHGSGK